MSAKPNLNGARVTRRDGTIFIQLPREMWRLIEGGCKCPTCTQTGRAAYWDTLAIAAKHDPQTKDRLARNDTAWTVHQPEPIWYERFRFFPLDGEPFRVDEVVGVHGYFTVVIPWSDTPTEWHPTERDKRDAFNVLTRGCFESEQLAREWANEKLEGQPYTVDFHEMAREEKIAFTPRKCEPPSVGALAAVAVARSSKRGRK